MDCSEFHVACDKFFCLQAEVNASDIATDQTIVHAQNSRHSVSILNCCMHIVFVVVFTLLGRLASGGNLFVRL